MHVVLTKKNSACGFEPANDFGVFGGDTILEYSAGCGRLHAGRIEQIL